MKTRGSWTATEAAAGAGSGGEGCKQRNGAGEQASTKMELRGRPDQERGYMKKEKKE
jgi:hypothetical protein